MFGIQAPSFNPHGVDQLTVWTITLYLVGRHIDRYGSRKPLPDEAVAYCIYLRAMHSQSLS